MTENLQQNPGQQQNGPERAQRNAFEEKTVHSMFEMEKVIGERLAVTEKWASGEALRNWTGVAEITGTDRGRAMFNTLLQIYKEKADQLSDSLSRLEKAENKEYLLGVQDVMLASIRNRMQLILDMFTEKGQNSISTAPEYQELIEKGLPLLRAINVPAILVDHLKEPARGQYIKDIESQAETLVPDIFNVLQDIQNSSSLEPITEKNWDIILANIDHLNKESGNWVKNSIGAALLSAIPEHQRPILLQKMLDRYMIQQGPEAVRDMLTAMIAGGYVSVGQALYAVDGYIANWTQKITKKHKRMKKADEEYLKRLVEMKTALASPALAQVQTQMDERRAHARVSLDRGTFGQRNSASSLFTLKGIAGMVLTINGGIGMMVNTIASLRLKDIYEDPEQLVYNLWSTLENPGFQTSVGMVAVGTEMSQGLGGALPTPSSMLSSGTHWLQSREKDKDLKQDRSREAVEKTMTRYPNFAEFYVNFAEKINEVYSEKKRNAPLTYEHSITLQDLGLDFNQLPQELKAMNQKEIEQKMTEWVNAFDHNEVWRNEGPTAQIQFIQNCREKEGLPPYATWSEETKNKMKTKQ